MLYLGQAKSMLELIDCNQSFFIKSVIVYKKQSTFVGANVR